MKQLFNAEIINEMIMLAHKSPPLDEIYSPEAKDGYNKTLSSLWLICRNSYVSNTVRLF